MATLRHALKKIAHKTNEWAGIPMPLEGERLVIEPTYPNAEMLMAMGRAEAPPLDEEEARVGEGGFRLRNTFWSWSKRSYITVYEDDGKIQWSIRPGVHHLNLDLQALGCADAWGIEQESNAIHTLGTLIRHRQFKQYMLTGMFMEQSKRSGIHYLFRRLKPTVALRSKDDDMKILCCLCMHPIGYYARSWAGAMVPTDDVISHLALMRGDEAMYWRRANQHPSWVPEAGL